MYKFENFQSGDQYKTAMVARKQTKDALLGESTIITIEKLAGRLKTGERLLGLDVGSKTIGLALSDVSRTIASPLQTIRRTKFAADAEELANIVAEHAVAGLVIGLPINMDGSEGPRAQSTRAFARNLNQKSDLPMVLWDERLSTAAAERALLEADASRKRRSEVIDKMAAGFILQGALDRLAHMS
ncbi:MAG: Holliday junction resolvase RuvX [Hyphomicrobiales bacterium]|nr:Holliday junction resolvase RuvX [Hyphomicrobiales bacterium]